MPKLYFSDTGLRNININDLRALNKRPDMGTLAENYFYSEFLKKGMILSEVHFWRDKQQHEVDFVIVENRKPIPVEIKYQRFTKPEISTSLKAFIDKFKPAKAIIFTKDYQDVVKGSTHVYFVPLWMM